MLNLKNISKLFLATFVLSAMVTLPRLAAAAEIDCSGKEGYALQICEQQKALAEKNAKSDAKADNKAQKAATKAADKQKAAEAELAAQRANALGKDGSINKKYEAQDKKLAAQSAQQKAAAEKAAAAKEMSAALKSGDTAAANAAKEKMAAADKAASKAAAEAAAAAKQEKEAAKEVDKQYKAATKAQEKADKATAKAEKEKVKAAEKQEKTAAKDATKAQKEIDKLEKDCQKNPDKCDTNALQAAYAKKEAADALAKEAQKNREDVDGTTAARQKAEEERLAAEEAQRQQMYMGAYEEEEPNEAEIQAYDCVDSSTGQSCTLSASNQKTCICKYKSVYTDASGLTKEGAVDAFDKLDKNGNPVAMQRCYEARGVFEVIACKSMTTLADLRVIVYTLAGFGLIAFAFGAIFNKISWKHLAHLSFALFLLSMMTPFIEYFTQKDGTALKYGNYLPAGFSSVSGSDANTPTACDTKKGDVCPDVNVDTSAKDSKWSWKDLKNTVKSGISAAKKGYDTYKTVKSTVETVATQAQKIGTAIKNHEGGLTGILDTMGEVATASNTIMNSTKLAAGAVVANTSSIATDVQNAGKSGAELAFDKENQNRIDELEKKMAAGNLSPQQMEYAKAELEQRKAAVDKNKVADIANNQGSKALDKINKVADTGSKVTKATTVAANAAQVGSNIGGGIGTAGGDIVGGIFGAATLLGEGIDIKTQNQNAKEQAAAAEKAKADKAAAEAKRQEEVRKKNASYSQGKQWDGSFNATSSGDSGTKSNAATGGEKPIEAPKPSTSSSSNKSTSSSSSSGTKPNTNIEMPKDTVTKTETYTFGGDKTGLTDGPQFNMPESTVSTTTTLVDAVQNPNGTITQKDPSGRSVTYDAEGNIINIKGADGKIISGREDTYWDGVTMPTWGK